MILKEIAAVPHVQDVKYIISNIQHRKNFTCILVNLIISFIFKQLVNIFSFLFCYTEEYKYSVSKLTVRANFSQLVKSLRSTANTCWFTKSCYSFSLCLSSTFSLLFSLFFWSLLYKRCNLFFVCIFVPQKIVLIVLIITRVWFIFHIRVSLKLRHIFFCLLSHLLCSRQMSH